MFLKKINLDNNLDDFRKIVGDLGNYYDYKKRLKSTMRLLQTRREPFAFFHKFRFGSKRDACFLFGQIDESPWKELIDGKPLLMPEMEEEAADQWEFLLEKISLTLQKKDDRYYVVSNDGGWEHEFRSSTGICWRRRSKYGPSDNLYIRVRTDRGVFRRFRDRLEVLLDAAFGQGNMRLVPFHDQNHKDFWGDLLEHKAEWESRGTSAAREQLLTSIEEWVDDYMSYTPKEAKDWLLSLKQQLEEEG